jgi:hypothetical protein
MFGVGAHAAQRAVTVHWRAVLRNIQSCCLFLKIRPSSERAPGRVPTLSGPTFRVVDCFSRFVYNGKPL